MMGGVVYDLGQYKDQYDTLDDFFKNSFWNFDYYKYPIMFGITLFIHFPLCSIKDIGKLRFTSLMGIVVFFTIVLILVIESPFYVSDYWKNVYVEDDPSTHYDILDMSKGFGISLEFFKGLGGIFFAFACHFGAFPIMKNIKDATEPRLNKVFSRSMIISTIIYLIVAIVGFISIPINTPDFIVSRYSVFKHDYFVVIGKVLFAINIIFKIPVHFNALRLAFSRFCFDTTEMGSTK